LVCAGGTGGGVYPALAVVQALNAKQQGIHTLWVGSEGGMEAELVGREGLAFAPISSAGLHGVGLRAFPRNLLTLARGLFAARKILRDFRPDVLFFTGGFVAGPVALASRLAVKPVPTLVYVPDIEPGLALKALARFADRIAASTPDSQEYFAGKVAITGYPLRSNLAVWTRKTGRAALKLNDDLPVVLVVGGSRGARSINDALMAQLPTLLELAQVVHITGQLDWGAVQRQRTRLTSAHLDRYQAFPYLHDEMGAALAAADLVIARAGASALGEFPFFGLPAIVVPYPHAWRYQQVNAEYLARHDAAILIDDDDLSLELSSVVKDLLQNPSRLEAMRKAMRSLARPQAAQAIAQQLLELGGQQP
jgi:UDP-N-acetylglucosamine--N-acetylmuramyl-(pentapeptide) pyrophosphoryl-undecaprenol N-acetylglucosamine transferase